MLLTDGFTAIASVHGETLTIVSSGETFAAVLLVESVVEVNELLGSDARERVVAHVARASCPSVDGPITVTDEAGNVCRLDGRKDNPADQTVDFECTRIVSGKDS
jgi:hypothetical protein